MLPIRTLLHPTDFSPCSDLAFEVAASLARDYGARLVVAHIGRPPLQHLGGGPTPVPPLAIEWGREELERQLRQRTVPDLTHAPEYRLEFAENPGEAILCLAREIDCDLIVLGTHGRTGVGRLLLGSIAEHVLRRAECPVLTVRQVLSAASSCPQEGPQFSTVQR
jgi:nucleotide-binding universal stress UspA family protein